jgi:hypothetical protein
MYACLCRRQEVPGEPLKDSDMQLYPVSINHDPPFTMMTHLSGMGDLQAGGIDSNAVLTSYGTWQPGLSPGRKPSVVDALVGSLSARGGAAGTGGRQEGSQGLFVDVGAGQGFFSLAAAAKGHQVMAFEVSADSLGPFRASIEYNGFQGLVDLRNVSLGAEAGVVCLQPQQLEAAAVAVAGEQPGGGTGLVRGDVGSSSSSTSRGGGGGGSGDEVGGTALRGAAGDQQGSPGPLTVAGSSGLQPAMAVAAFDELAAWQEQREARLRVRRGYAHVADGAGDASEPACKLRGKRWTLTAALEGRNTKVNALRIAAHGHEGWVLEGAMPFFKRMGPPEVLYLEFSPAAMKAAGYKEPQKVLQLLHELGYKDGAHSGHACDRRWMNVTRALRSQVGVRGAGTGGAGRGKGRSGGTGQGCEAGPGWAAGGEWTGSPEQLLHIAMSPALHAQFP